MQRDRKDVAEGRTMESEAQKSDIKNEGKSKKENKGDKRVTNARIRESERWKERMRERERERQRSIRESVRERERLHLINLVMQSKYTV